MSDTKTKSQPTFFLTESIIQRVVRDERITANHVAALLVVACHTDKTGVYSSMSAYAVRKRLAISDAKAQRLLQDLNIEFLLIDTPANWEELGKADDIPKRTGRSAVRWIIPPDDSRKIWFPTSLVHGINSWKYPLAKLRQCGDLAARLLLALYMYENVPDYGGIDPTKAMLYLWETISHKEVRHGMDMHLFIASRAGFFAYISLAHALSLPVTQEDGKHLLPKAFRPALEKLITAGFIYEVLTVFTGTTVSEEMELLYPLHTFNRYGHPPKGEEPLSGLTASLASLHNVPLTMKGGRFFGNFAFVADTEEAQLVGIFRLRFRDTSACNHEGRLGWAYIQACKNEWEATLLKKEL